MSAAEKLRDLEQHAPGNHWDAEISAALRDALPEIIAVVEAAENFDARFEERFIRGMAAPLNEALAALDAKLSVT